MPNRREVMTPLVAAGVCAVALYYMHGRRKLALTRVLVVAHNFQREGAQLVAACTARLLGAEMCAPVDGPLRGDLAADGVATRVASPRRHRREGRRGRPQGPRAHGHAVGAGGHAGGPRRARRVVHPRKRAAGALPRPSGRGARAHGRLARAGRVRLRVRRAARGVRASPTRGDALPLSYSLWEICSITVLLDCSLSLFFVDS